MWSRVGMGKIIHVRSLGKMGVEYGLITNLVLAKGCIGFRKMRRYWQKWQQRVTSVLILCYRRSPCLRRKLIWLLFGVKNSMRICATLVWRQLTRWFCRCCRWRNWKKYELTVQSGTLAWQGGYWEILVSSGSERSTREARMRYKEHMEHAMQ